MTMTFITNEMSEEQKVGLLYRLALSKDLLEYFGEYGSMSAAALYEPKAYRDEVYPALLRSYYQRLQGQNE